MRRQNRHGKLKSPRNSLDLRKPHDHGIRYKGVADVFAFSFVNKRFHSCAKDLDSGL